MDGVKFGAYLQLLRKRKKLTARQLDLYSGVSHSYISQMERGARGIPSPDILKKLSKPLGVTYEELMSKAGYFDSGERKFDELLYKVCRFFIQLAKNNESVDGVTKILEEQGYDEKFIDDFKNDFKDQSIDEIISELTLDEKITLLHTFIDAFMLNDIEIKNENDVNDQISNKYNSLSSKKREMVDNMIDMLYSDS